jgi:hypothetical protein
MLPFAACEGAEVSRFQLLRAAAVACVCCYLQARETAPGWSLHYCCGIAVREALGAVAGCLAEALGRTPNEAAMFRDYGRAVLALDEVICEVRGCRTTEP